MIEAVFAPALYVAPPILYSAKHNIAIHTNKMLYRIRHL